MNRVRRISILMTAVLLVYCIISLSADLLMGEEREEVKKISVFVSAEKEEHMEYFRKGILAASGESLVDVKYVNVPGGEDMLQYLERECSRDTQAVILMQETIQSDEGALWEQLEDYPVIAVNRFESTGRQVTEISFDVEQAAELLAEEITDHYAEHTPVVLLAEKGRISAKVAETMERAFQDRGLETETLILSESRQLQYRKYTDGKVFVGCWMTETEMAMNVLDGRWLYGVGYSEKILNGIRQGRMAGVAAFSMYAEGIHAMQQAIGASEKKVSDNICVPCRMITERNITEEQEFLIPVD